MAFLPKKKRAMPVRSIAHAMARLPATQIVREITRKRSPVVSNWRKGTSRLQRTVKIGEKT